MVLVWMFVSVGATSLGYFLWMVGQIVAAAVQDRRRPRPVLDDAMSMRNVEYETRKTIAEGRQARDVAERDGSWAVADGEFVTIDRVLAEAVAAELDRIDPQACSTCRDGGICPDHIEMTERRSPRHWIRICEVCRRVSKGGGRRCRECNGADEGVSDDDVEMQWIGRPPKSERRRARRVGERGAEPAIDLVPDHERRNQDIRGDID
jgi:hypothetical protein